MNDRASTRRYFLQLVTAFAAGSISRRLLAAPEQAELPWQSIECVGRYAGHLQGVCTDRKQHFFWSFTSKIVKTDAEGQILKAVNAPSHQGDLCYLAGKIYVAVNLGKFNQPAGQADSWVYVFDADSLEEIGRHRVPEAVHGAGGMDAHAGRFFVVGGLPADINENYVYEYDQNFRFQKQHVIPSGQTLLGIQTATHHDGCWWFGCYGKPAVLLKTDEQFRLLGRWNFDCALGLAGHSAGKFYVARGSKNEMGHAAKLLPAVADDQHGLALWQSGT